jgi:hypothetical protein
VQRRRAVATRKFLARGDGMAKYYIEQRRSPRVEINASGTLILLSQGLRVAGAIPCTVVNVSATGALIQASAAVEDEQFYLEVEGQPGKLQSCRVVRRPGGNRLGVAFL